MEGGFDLSMSEAGFAECLNGHVFCEDHLSENATVEEIAQSYVDKYSNKNYHQEEVERLRVALLSKDEEQISWALEEDWEDEYEVTPAVCPICRMEAFRDKDLLAFYLKLHGSTRKELEDTARELYGNYSKFKEYIEGVK